MSGKEGEVVRSLAAEIISAVAPNLGLKVQLEPKYKYVGRIETPDGRKFYFRNTHFDLNGLGSSEMAKDKDWAAYFMKRLGYPVPEGDTFYSRDWCEVVGEDKGIDRGYSYARQLGFPVIVKPNSRSQGSGVSKVYNKREFYQAMSRVFNQSKDRVALVQRFIEGEDYRIVVLDDEVISAYQRIPLSVVGDGRSTIQELLLQKQAQFTEEGRDTTIRLDDQRMVVKLRRQKLNPQNIPAIHERTFLLDNANLSTGGEAVDVTVNLHSEYRKLAVELTKGMGLRYCGVDVITRDLITEAPQNYTIVEINAAPGLDNYAQVGPKQKQQVERMYEKILLALTRKTQ